MRPNRLAGHFDAIRNAGDSLPHDISSRVWKNLVAGQPDAAFNTGNGYWTEDGFVFTGNVHASVGSPGIGIGGPFMTVQLVTDVDWEAQTFGSGYFSIFFGNDENNTDIYFNSSSANRTLILNADKWGTSGNRPTLERDGRYATAILGDGISYLLQDAALSGGKTRVNKDIPARRFNWGGQQDNPNYYAKGVFHSVRIYNRTFTEAELAHNRKVDEIRFRNAFPEYANLVVVNGMIGQTGIVGTSSLTSGEYELTGLMTVTADPVTVDGEVYRPRLSVEKFTGGEWRGVSRGWVDSCTVSGAERTRLSWIWERNTGTLSLVW